MLYQERLSPGIGTWFLVLVAGAGSFLVGAPISITAGIITAIVVILLVGIVLYSTSPVIEITENYVRIGRAQIERKFVGIAEAFHGEESRLAAGPQLDGRAFMCFRGWVDSKIRIEITDPADPTPYWLASTRNPEKIAAILNKGKEEQLAFLEEVRQQLAEEPTKPQD